jgi:hypothetical protein
MRKCRRAGAPGCSQSKSQFLEVYNSTPYDVRPGGLQLDRGTTLNRALEVASFGDGTIPPYTFGVVAVKTTASHCYGASWWDFEASAVASFGANPVAFIKRAYGEYGPVFTLPVGFGFNFTFLITYLIH